MTYKYRVGSTVRRITSVPFHKEITGVDNFTEGFTFIVNEVYEDGDSYVYVDSDGYTHTELNLKQFNYTKSDRT